MADNDADANQKEDNDNYNEDEYESVLEISNYLTKTDITPINDEISAIKESVKNIKNAFRKSTWVAGAKNQEDYKKAHKGLTDARNKREQAAFKLIDAAAKDAYNKKLSKTGSKAKAIKAEQKVYYKGFKQERYGAGLVGSSADSKKRHGVTKGNTHYYNHIAKVKGKKYANAVEKKYGKRLTKQLVGGIALATGAAIVGAYYNNK